MRRIFLVLCISAATAATGSVAAEAAVVTVGSPLTQPFTSTEANVTGTVINTVFPEPGALVVSPLSGVVIRWRTTAAAGGPFRLRVLRPQGGDVYAGVGTGPEQSIAAGPSGTVELPARIPIQQGDTIGLDIVKGAKIGTSPELPGSGFAAWSTPLVDGPPREADEVRSDREIAFSADVLPPPTLSSAKPASGSFTGGSKLTITGTDLTEVSAVTFGGVPAKSFAAISETSLTAVAPKVAKPVKADLAVTTAAGTATLPQAFQFKACKVPSLRGKTLKKAKKKLKKAGCKVGKVTRASRGAGRVTKQRPPAGKLKAAGTKVKVTLG